MNLLKTILLFIGIRLFFWTDWSKNWRKAIDEAVEVGELENS